MPVQINEIIIRAIITNDDPKGKSGPSPAPIKQGEGEPVNKRDVLSLIDEVLKNKKER
jgi:hypothetical protein